MLNTSGWYNEMEWLDDYIKGVIGIDNSEPIKAIELPSKPYDGVYSSGMQFSGTTGRSATNNNPLNLEYRPGSYQDKYGAEMEPVSKSGKQRFAKFSTMEDGYNAGLDQIRLDASRGHTLASFVNKFAPPHENPTNQIINQYSRAVGVSPDTLLSEIPPEKIIVPMLARESSTRIVSNKEGEILSALKNTGKRQKQRPFEPYQIAAAGNQIPGPPAATQEIKHPTYNPNGPNVDYLDDLLKGGLGAIQSQPVIKAAPNNLPSGEQIPPQNVTPADFATQAGAAYVDEPQTKFQIFAKRRFPLEKPEMAAKRYFIRDGEVFYMANDGQVRKELGEGFGEKAKSLLADLVGRAPEIAGGTVGALSPIPGGLEVGTVLGGLGRRASNQAMYGETPNYLTGVATDAAGAALSRIPAAGINKGLGFLGGGGQVGRMVARDTGVFNATEVQRLIDLGNQYGIRLTAPEITNSPTLQSIWGNLAQNPRWPQANQKIAEFIKRTRQPQVYDAIERELSAISPARLSQYDAGSTVQQTAKKLLGGLEDTRSTGVKPLYQDAYGAGTKVDIAPVHETIDSIIAKLPPNGTSAKQMQNIKTLLSETVDEIDPATGKVNQVIKPLSNLEQLHNAKIDLDTAISKLKAEGVLDKMTKRRIANIKSDLTEQMSAASPEYAEAQAKFAELSKPINQFKYGDANRTLLDPKKNTLMQRLVDLAPEEMEKVPGMIFKEPKEVIKRTKGWFTANGFEDEWNTIVKAHLEQQFNKVADSIASREGNFGYAFKRKVFGNEGQVERLRAAMDPQQFGSFSGLMDLMDQTTKIVYTNSQTAMQQGATQAIENLGGGVVARALTNIPVTPQQWGQVLIRLRSPGSASKLADAMLDPAVANQIRAMRLLPNNVKKVNEVMSFLGSIYSERKITDPKNIRNEVPEKIWRQTIGP